MPALAGFLGKVHGPPSYLILLSRGAELGGVPSLLPVLVHCGIPTSDTQVNRTKSILVTTRKSSCRKPQEAYRPQQNLSKCHPFPGGTPIQSQRGEGGGTPSSPNEEYPIQFRPLRGVTPVQS